MLILADKVTENRFWTELIAFDAAAVLSRLCNTNQHRLTQILIYAQVLHLKVERQPLDLKQLS